MKKMLHKYGTRPNEIRRAKRELYGRLSLVALVLVFFGMMTVITWFQPRLEEGLPEQGGTNQPQAERPMEEQVESLRMEVGALFSQFKQYLEEPETALDNLDMLENAINLQRQVIRSRSGDIASRDDLQKLEELLACKDALMGDYLIAQSTREEEQAMQAWSGGNRTDAISRMNRAIRVQEQINEQYPRSPHQDSTRLHRLTKQRLLWETQPIAEAADALKEQAYGLVSEGNFNEARKVIRMALQKQELLMQEYRDSSYATLTRMRTFQEARKEIDTAEDRARVDSLLDDSRSLLASGDHASATAKAGEALELQQKLTGEAALNEKAASARLESIREIYETAAGTPVFEVIKSAREKTRKALLARDMKPFQSNLADWYRESRAFKRRFPKSRLLEQIDYEEVNLLHAMRAEVPAILELVHSNLVNLPGSDSLYMFRTEVAQALYESVAGMNPSSSRDPALPVESVTWEEAESFTHRLSMILALPVYLPTEMQFRGALGTPSITAAREQAWSMENANRQVRPCGRLNANAAGFCDLLGNVAEWVSVDVPQQSGQVLAIGGSARDSAARIAQVPMDWRSAGERNRFIGFRFVVDRGRDLD